MRSSGLPPGWRHVIHVLCSYVDYEAGAILPGHQPSLTVLARDTGLHRRTVIRHLAGLEAGGWVTRQRPAVHDARTKHARTQYAVLIGEPHASGATAPELGTSHPRASGATAPELGASDPGSRGTRPPRSSPSRQSPAGETGAVIDAIRAKDGTTVSREWAARVAGQILGARSDVRDRAAYLRTVIANAPPGAYRPTPVPPRMADLCGWCTKPGHSTADCPNK